MSFNDLPPAILYLVASHLKERAVWLAAYATINRSWQSVVEALTFRELRSESIEHLRQIPLHMNSDRWDAFRTLDVIIQLPQYDRERWYDSETDEDQEVNNTIFSTSLEEVFNVIKTWENVPQFTLAIQAISKSDYWHLGSADRSRRSAKCIPGAEDIRQQASYLRFAGVLSPLPVVSSLVLRGAHVKRSIQRAPGRSCCPRQLSGEVVSRIIRACPNVNVVKIELSDEESKDLELRNAQRSAFATSLSDLPSSLRHLDISYPGVVPANESFSPPAIPSVDGRDLLSHRLSVISRQLQSLEVKGVLSDDLFDITDPSSFWPHLQSLSVDFVPCTPSGDWMLDLDPEDSEIEPIVDYDRRYQVHVSLRCRRQSEWPARMHFPERKFRTAVNRDILDDIHLAVAQAMTRMPNLRDLRLNVGDAESGCALRFTSNGESAHKVVWQSRSATMYEPHADVIAAWKQVFADRTGELVIQVL